MDIDQISEVVPNIKVYIIDELMVCDGNCFFFFLHQIYCAKGNILSYTCTAVRGNVRSSIV
jgi:hypothetical protein